MSKTFSNPVLVVAHSLRNLSYAHPSAEEELKLLFTSNKSAFSEIFNDSYWKLPRREQPTSIQERKLMR